MNPIFITIAGQVINLAHVANFYTHGFFITFRFSDSTKVEVSCDNPKQAEDRYNLITSFLERDPRRFVEHIP